MEKSDLGDRYTNSLKYLIAPNLETISDFESPVVTDRSETDSNSINSELISMLETLSQTINLEHRHRNNAEVFIPPSGFNELEVSSKITFIHSLTQSLSTYISTGKFPITQFSEGERLETPKLRVKKDVISRLVNCNDGVYLNHNDLKQLAAMLIGSFRDSAKFQVKELAGVNKAKLELKKKEFIEVSEEMDLLNSNQEKMIFENTSLRNDVKKYKQQIGNLEKQLASSKTECEGLESTCRTIREELICKRKLIQDMIRGDCEQMNLRLSISKLSIKPK